MRICEDSSSVWKIVRNSLVVLSAEDEGQLSIKSRENLAVGKFEEVWRLVPNFDTQFSLMVL